MSNIFKKITSPLIVFSLFIALSVPVAASPSLSDDKVTEEEESNAVKDDKYVEENKVYEQEINTSLDGSVSPLYVEYPIGTTRTLDYHYSGTGIIDEEEDKASGILNTVKGIGMTVLGYYVDNVEGVILGAADVLASQIDFDQYVTAKTFKSYRYIGKEGQVYDYSGWEKHYDARSRQVYKHYLGTYVTEDSSTRTDSTDYTHDRGYSPVTTNYSPNFNNESELEERAWYNWYNGGGYRYPEYW